MTPEQITGQLTEAQRRHFLSLPTDGSRGSYLADIGKARRMPKRPAFHPLKARESRAVIGRQVRAILEKQDADR